MLLTGLPGQQTERCGDLIVKDRLISWGYQAPNRTRNIEAIIIHSSYNAMGPDSFSLAGVLKEFRRINVAPHFIIDRNGTIYRLVKENDIAYQAGKSRLPDGTTDVNRVSIGIEVINSKFDSPTPVQYESLASLVDCLKRKYSIRYVMGHDQIAPGRKTDPWNFDWIKFDSLLRKR